MKVTRLYTVSETASIIGVAEVQVMGVLPALGIDLGRRANRKFDQQDFDRILRCLKPYHIQTTREKDDPVALDELADLMRSRGAIPTPSGLKLAFADESEAVTTMADLARATDTKYWTLTCPPK